MESWEMVPFEKLHVENSDGRWYSVFCDDCLSSGGDHTTALSAAKAWNERVKM